MNSPANRRAIVYLADLSLLSTGTGYVPTRRQPRTPRLTNNTTRGIVYQSPGTHNDHHLSPFWRTRFTITVQRIDGPRSLCTVHRHAQRPFDGTEERHFVAGVRYIIWRMEMHGTTTAPLQMLVSV